MLGFTICPECQNKKLYDEKKQRVKDYESIQIQVTIGDHSCTSFLDNLQVTLTWGNQAQYLGQTTAEMIKKIQNHIENLKQEG